MLPERLSRGSVVALFAGLALLLLPFADLHVAGHDPWAAVGRMAQGVLRPDFAAIEQVGWSLVLTVAFAVAGVALGGTAGLALAPFYGNRIVRLTCVALRSVHELFWALLLMQALGIGALTGVLAIALPYAGIFAKVFAEQMEDADPRPSAVLPPGVDPLSRFLFARAPLMLPAMRTYSLYRVECGLRSSAVLGFVGLPTLGYQLETVFSEGDYGAASAILIIYVSLIATMRLWMRPHLVPLWVLLSGVVLTSLSSPPMGQGALLRFLTVDIVPAPLRNGEGLGAFLAWLWPLLTGQVIPGLAATLVVAQIALVLTGLVAVATSGLVVPSIAGRLGSLAGHLALVILRSIPEVMLAFVFLQILGPSMLPAVLALAIHNGAIIGHLLGREAEATGATLRRDAPRGLTLWAWELAPRLFGRFLALCLYRWEIILREAAVMGLLGVATLGFFVDGAVAELRLDRAVVLLVSAGVLTAGVDALSRALRRRIGADRARIQRDTSC
ncbi:ABC transporter permease [Rubellimicrobium rubrum]|uniref:ABC transporter permease n=1 Tax=Rubellimicrobium rubrum TaxID=2585369 RepID=A0A5C4N6F9_9RHOB|nr:ABC transporter permease [Rubellimicrobium rubrum]TNC51941.1 ABC transporter permease [Rubellimicrobium rubrum]